MKETVNVSIAGIAFILDKQCYAMLSNYLTQTEASLGGNRELVADVEARIAEQILNVQSADKPVSMDVLSPIIMQLGGSQPQTSTESPNMFAKRLYRNPSGSMLGGVCNGLGSYFNMNPVIFRALFLVPVFFGGMTIIWDMDVFRWVFSSLNSTSLLIYVILWIVIPKARTPRQQLEMQGDQITVDSISQQTVNQRNDVAANVATTILKVIAITFACILLISALFSVSVAMVAMSVGTIHYPDGITAILDVLGLGYGWAMLWVSALMLLPIFAICYLIFSAVFSLRHSKLVVGIMFLVWFCLLMAAFVLMIAHTTELAAIGNNHHWYWD